MSIEVIATLEARPEREAEVEAALRVLLTHSRQEPGVRRYDLYRDSTRPATFHLLEAYADEAALEAHRASAHYLRYRELAGDWLKAAPMIAVLEPVALPGLSKSQGTTPHAAGRPHSENRSGT